LAGCGLVALANLCQLGNMSLGYPIVMYHAILYGILLGTNSFSIPAPVRFAPSLTTVLNRSGAFEITAYIAIAAATKGLVIWRQPSLLNWRSEQVGSWRKWRLNSTEIAVIAGAILLLAALRNIGKHLTSDGCLVFDAFLGQVKESQLYPAGVVRVSG
jgi:hypothetical protein